MDDTKKMLLYIFIALALEMLVIAVCCAFSPGSASEPNHCEMKVYEYMNEYRINTSCGHIVIDRCPFCDKRIEIIIED